MFIDNDPMLALIARFVVDVDSVDVSENEFLQQQIQVLQTFLEGFPESERDERALEWVEHRAERYRHTWQQRVVTDEITDRTCPDCPLVANKGRTRCEIHDQWVSLLDRYVADEMTSRKYVEDTLKLLVEHKERLRVAFSRGH